MVRTRRSRGVLIGVRAHLHRECTQPVDEAFRLYATTTQLNTTRQPAN